MPSAADHAGAAYRIRRAHAVDVPALAQTHVECWHETYRGLVPDRLLESFTAARGRSAWDRILRDAAPRVYVVEHDGAVIGFGSCGSQRSAELAAVYDGEISSLYVLRAFQRRGIGAALLHTLAGDLIDGGFRGASLWVLRDNATARRFYERCGGARVGERDDVRERTVLHEVAYGWPAAARLREVTANRGLSPAPAD